jgi:uncharacterized membrane protein YedE/YeeE
MQSKVRKYLIPLILVAVVIAVMAVAGIIHMKGQKQILQDLNFNPAPSLVLLNGIVIVIFGLIFIASLRDIDSPRWFLAGLLIILLGNAGLGIWAGYYAITWPTNNYPDVLVVTPPPSVVFYEHLYSIMQEIEHDELILAVLLFIAALIPFANLPDKSSQVSSGSGGEVD